MRTYTTMFLQALLAGSVIFSTAYGQEKSPQEILQSEASFLEKGEACRILSLKGDAASVDLLAPLLKDEKLSHMARLALEAMPLPEAGAALRKGLSETNGALKIGLIGSLAVRRDTEAVSLLIPLLKDTDTAVVEATAAALGYLPTPEAMQALTEAMGKADAPKENQAAFADALCAGAAAGAAKGDTAQAAVLYQIVADHQDLSTPIQCAALRGLILTSDPEKGLALLGEALQNEDEARFMAALRAARELKHGEALSEVLAKALPGIAEDRKAAAIALAGEIGGEAIGEALMAEAKNENTGIGVAALNALTRIAYSPVLALAQGWLFAEDTDLAQAARKVVSYFPGKEADAILEAMLKSDALEERRLAVELVGNGGLEKPETYLIAVAQTDSDESIRIAAIDALRNHAGKDQLPQLIDCLRTAASPEVMKSAENTLTALCSKQRKTDMSDVHIEEACYGKLPDGPKADVLGKINGLLAAGNAAIDVSNNAFGDTAPGMPKQLYVRYTLKGAPATQIVSEGEQLVLNTAAAPVFMVEAFTTAMQAAQGEAQAALVRLLGATGSPQAFTTVCDLAFNPQGGPMKDTALRVVCDWPNTLALPKIMEMALSAEDPAVVSMARGGAVRLLGQGALGAEERIARYGQLMEHAASADDKKLVLSGLGQVARPAALDMALAQFADPAVKAEAVQAAINIAKGLGASPVEDTRFAGLQNIDDWQGDKSYWKFEEGSVVGYSDAPIPRNEFLWAPKEVTDFYLALDVKLDPPTANAGIQFRSKKVDEHGQALGYQADMGKDVWGRLYHEHGRGKLDWTDKAEGAVKPGEWNRYEILAVGPAIWTALNGELGVACLDLGEGERSGGIAVQIHAGAPQTVHYRFVKLIEHPAVKLGTIEAKKLFEALTPPASK